MSDVRSFEDTVAILQSQDVLTAIVEDWDAGIKVLAACSGGDLAAELARLYERDGALFRFRAFNKQVDLSWSGSFGVVHVGDPGAGAKVMLRLEPDQKKHPGMRAFAKDGKVTGCIDAQIVEGEHGSRALRFLKYYPGGEASGPGTV